VNHKRTYRLYPEHGLQVRTKKRRKLPRRDQVAPQVPERPMQRWSMDFVSDQLADCRRFRVPGEKWCAGPSGAG
jgi:putative transposase